VARAFGYNEDQANALRDSVDRHTMTRAPTCRARHDHGDPDAQSPRHLGIHSAGMVLCDDR